MSTEQEEEQKRRKYESLVVAFPEMFNQKFEEEANDVKYGFTKEQLEENGLEQQQACLNEERYDSIYPAREVHKNHKVIKWEFTTANGHVLGAALGAFHGFLATAKIPGVAAHHPLTKEGNYHVSLPVNVNLASEEIELPLAVIDALIDNSPNHVILDRCVCRSGRHCKHHDPTIGCLFLGDSGLDVIPHYSRQVSAEEAKAHARRGIADGLVPMTCRTQIDNIAFQLEDRHTLLGICFCCDCCCYMAHFRSAPTKQLDLIYPRLQGLSITVDPNKCEGCGKCMETCFMDCISIKNGIAVHGDKCRGCGRCETACPNGAVTLTLSDPDYKDLTVEKFLSIADLSEKRPQIPSTTKQGAQHEG